MYGTYTRLNLSVHASDLAVIRAARRKVARKHRTARAMREARHAFYRTMLQYHHDARAIVNDWRL